MTDYSDTISQYATVPQSQTIGSINDDPDDAADALKLSSDTGVDSSAILGDLDNFKAQHKAVLASDIVANNPQLQDYVRSHPLAAKVSNDDWGVMDAVSSAGGWLDRAHDYMWKHDPLTQAGQEALSEAGEGLAQDPFPTPDTYNPLSRLAWSALGVPLRIGSAIFGGVTGAAEGAATTIGGEQFGRDIRGMVENEMLASGPEGVHGAQYWIENGLAAPPGVSPTIDRIRAAANIEGLNSLSDKLTEAQGSSTRERSPEMFRNFIAQRYGNATIGISGDAVTALYGDKTPAQGDGLLGFSPGMADQLELARQTGADVHVPIADWLTHVDPAVATQLHDDIRVWPNGVTAREAATPVEPNQVIDAPLPQVRDALATEPMFAVGDRKLSLTPIESGSEDFHDYHILDQTGNHVGDLEIIPDPKKKELYVSMINGVAGQYANSFGPSLMRDLKAQLKSIYPDYEWLTGDRVSGARYASGAYDRGETTRVRVALAAPEAGDIASDYNTTQDIFNGASVKQLAPKVSANIRPTELLSENEANLAQYLREEGDRILGPGAVKITPADRINYQDLQGIGGKPVNPHGIYVPQPGDVPHILYDITAPDQPGIVRHEFTHALRRTGLIPLDKWNILAKAAVDEGWLDKYQINKRYHQFNQDTKIEEAVAEARREWENNKETEAFTQPVKNIFAQIKQIYDNVRARLSQLFGREPTWEELFQQIHEGKFAGEGGDTEAEPAFSIDNRDQVQAQAMGLDLKSYQRLQSAIKARYDADLEAATKRAMAEQKREQTKEWKVNKAEVTKTVSDQIRQRPDVAADLFFGSGELFGEKIQQRFSMRSADLTDEQKATLPTRYYSKEGIPVDEAARLFGFTSGDAMVQKLGEYHATKAGLTSQEMLKQTTDAEVDRQMQAKYGSLGDNIMTEARDQALSESDLNLIAEEMQAAGLRAGTPVIDKTVAKDWAAEQFGKQTIGDANTDRLMATVGRHGRDTERSLIGGDSASAMVSLQKKYLSALIAADSAKLDKEKTQFAKLAKSMARKEVKSMDPEYLNWVQNILQRVGQRTQRMPWDIKADIEGRSQNTLEDFINDKQGMLRELPVAGFLLDPKWNKDFPTLTVDEFRAVHDSLKALVHNGRDEMKIVRAGEARDFGEVKEGLVGQLANTAKLSYDAKGRRWMGPIPPGIASKIRTYVASSTQIENLLNRFDHFDPHGLWNQYVMRDLIDGSNTKDSLVKKYASRLAETDDGVDLKRTVDNPLFRDPIGGGKLEFTRANLRAIMLNTGNASNLDKLERGYNLTSGSVRAWVDQHATKEDWDWTQKIWDVFADIKKESDTMYRSLTGGVAPGSVKITPVQTQFGDYAGGYYPVIYHPKFEGTSKKLLGGNPLEQQNYVRATTPSGHTKERTGYAAPMALDIDPLPNRIQQMLHDIALRPAVINASKVFYDKDIRTAIAAHYGTEYRDLLIPYVRDVANVSNYISSSQAELDSLGGFFRQNLVTSLVGLNIGTVAKHAPTALVTSINEVGAVNFLKAVRGMFSVNPDTGESNYQFAMKNSLELQRRDLNFSESLYGAAGQISSPGGFRSMQQFIRENASKPIAFSDKLSAVPTWLAQYNKSMSESGVHGDAIYDADRAVRRAHGSTAITNRPAIVRVTSPWLTTFYNFFSDILNRQMETVWKAGEAVDLAKSGQFQAAMGHVPEIAAGLFAYAIWPAVVEQLVSPTGGKNQSWTSKAAEALGSTLSSSWVGVRDLVNAMMAGRDPTLGLGGTALGYAAQTYKDLHDKYPSKQKNERIIIHAAQLGGLMTGMVPAPVGRLTAFGYGTNVGIEHPKGPWSWLVGARYGTLKNHSSTLENYLAGKPW